MDNATFYEKAKKHSKLINPFAVLVQCNWESREKGKEWATELCTKANNCAGLKVWNEWNGAVYPKVSWEQNSDGTKVNRMSLFCNYATIEEFMENYVLKITSSYPKCYLKRDNFFGYFDGLFEGKWGAWATDRAYFSRLVSNAIALAPQIFGDGWERKIMFAYEYAIDKRYLSDERQKILTELLGSAVAVDPLPVSKQPQKLICLDFGHGGKDSGAFQNGIREKDVNLAYGQRIGANLSGLGYDLMYTRVGDEYVQLSERARIAERHRPLPLVFLSFHANSSVRIDASGFEVYTYYGQDESDRLATEIIKSVQRAFPSMKINKDMSDGDPDKEANFAVLRETPNIPSALVELGFLSNPTEAKNIMNTNYREKLCFAIARGVDSFLGGA